MNLVAPVLTLNNYGITTQREFRIMKRRHLHLAREALHDLLDGAAYAPPMTNALYEMLDELRRVEKAWSEARWTAAIKREAKKVAP